MIALRVPGAPEFVEVARQAAGGGDDDVGVDAGLFHGAYDLALRGQWRVVGVVRRLDGVVPSFCELSILVLEFLGHSPRAERGFERVDRGSGVGHDGERRQFGCVRGRDVDVDDLDVWILKYRMRGGREVAPPRANADHQVGAPRDLIRGGRAGRADRTDALSVVETQRTLARLCFGDRDAGRGNQLIESLGRRAVDDAAARDDQRPRGRAQLRRETLDELGLRNSPDAIVEQRVGELPRLGLHVLGEREGHGTGFGGIGEDPHRVEHGLGQLFGPPDSVEVLRDRSQGVVHRHVECRRVFEFLENGVGSARGEDVARQQQHRNSIRRRYGGAGHHVGRARTDRGGAGEGPQSIRHARIAHGGMDHGLFVARQVIGEVVPALEERLTETGHVAVTEDAEAAREETMLLVVALDRLHAQESHECLGHGESHRTPRHEVIGSRGSTT